MTEIRYSFGRVDQAKIHLRKTIENASLRGNSYVVRRSILAYGWVSDLAVKLASEQGYVEIVEMLLCTIYKDYNVLLRTPYNKHMSELYNKIQLKDVLKIVEKNGHKDLIAFCNENSNRYKI